jgi:predicted transport protein
LLFSASSAPLVTPARKQKAVCNTQVYTEDTHLNGKPEEVIELYNRFKSVILNSADRIELQPRKLYIAFKHEETNICEIFIQRKGLRIFIDRKAGALDDPKKIMRDVSKIGHWATGDYSINVENDSKLEYIMSLIKQAI